MRHSNDRSNRIQQEFPQRIKFLKKFPLKNLHAVFSSTVHYDLARLVVDIKKSAEFSHEFAKNLSDC